MSTNENLESNKAQMRKGLLEFCVLLIVARGKAYASDILEQLKSADLIVVEGTLYPLLSRLRSEHLVEYSWEESSAGPPRKYYTLTEQGKDMLHQLKLTWKHLAQSINSLQQ